MKDYYAILGVNPSATLKELKSAYRRLVLQYHPDKNPSGSFAESRFRLITEAYQTLTTPALKEAYLQKRWLNRAMGTPAEPPAVTPPQILDAILKANRAFAAIDAYRVDKKGLFKEMTALVDDEKVIILNQAGQEDINYEVVRWITDSLHILAYADQMLILARLKKINAGLKAAALIQQKEKEVLLAIVWDRFRPFLILLIIILLCAAIAYSL